MKVSLCALIGLLHAPAAVADPQMPPATESAITATARVSRLGWLAGNWGQDGYWGHNLKVAREDGVISGSCRTAFLREWDSFEIRQDGESLRLEYTNHFPVRKEHDRFSGHEIVEYEDYTCELGLVEVGPQWAVFAGPRNCDFVQMVFERHHNQVIVAVQAWEAGQLEWREASYLALTNSGARLTSVLR